MVTLVAFGVQGAGKSSTLNTWNNNFKFSVGHGAEPKTKETKFVEDGNNLSVDLVGIGEVENRDAFYNSFLKKKTSLLHAAPISAFLLVVKFENEESSTFLNSAREFHSIFGTVGLNSLIIICIQTKDQDCPDDFEKIMKKSDGYAFLNEKNNQKPIPFCIWDNLKPHTNKFNQFEILKKLISDVTPYTKQAMQFAFDSAEKELEKKKINERKEVKLTPENKNSRITDETNIPIENFKETITDIETLEENFIDIESLEGNLSIMCDMKQHDINIYREKLKREIKIKKLIKCKLENISNESIIDFYEKHLINYCNDSKNNCKASTKEIVSKLTGYKFKAESNENNDNKDKNAELENLKTSDKYILVTGSTNDQTREFLFEHLFQLKYVPSSMVYKSNDFIIIDQSNLNRLSFDRNKFKSIANKIGFNLHKIICIENLNPRHETLKTDLDILTSVFGPDELNKKIIFINTFSSQLKSLEELRNTFLKLNDFFQILMIDQADRSKFVENNVWILDRANPEFLKDVKKIILPNGWMIKVKNSFINLAGSPINQNLNT